jgi:hypothetical protein
MNLSDLMLGGGFIVLFAGVVWSNVAVSKMAKIVRVDWFVKSDKKARETIRLYRAHNGDGFLYRDLKIAYWLCGIGAVMISASLLSTKF